MVEVTTIGLTGDAEVVRARRRRVNVVRKVQNCIVVVCGERLVVEGVSWK